QLNGNSVVSNPMKPQPIANPPNPWASTSVQYLEDVPLAKVEVYEDHTREIVARNDSPDLGFRFSVNPYRGCNHACAYCFARPSHEYLSFGAGTDFDTKIMAKLNAPQLLRNTFERPSWKGDRLMFSGVTDCYQPLEASLKLTRGCLEVCAEYRNPISIITKGVLIERDLELLQQLNRESSVSVALSIPIWDPELARAIEPGAPSPQRRIEAIRKLSAAGIPVGVMVAPIIPGVSDEGMARVLEAAKDAGARFAGYVLLRLPSSVKAVFEERIRAALPLRADKILHRVRETRGGKLYDSRWGVRGVGEGPYAEMIARTFEVTVKRLGLVDRFEEDPPTPFRRPPKVTAQLSLF
ncbi:MAG: radical protein, partial [Myxococcaceae bacterium]|nr:radical protein [Myxococcaceae bacterium]